MFLSGALVIVALGDARVHTCSGCALGSDLAVLSLLEDRLKRFLRSPGVCQRLLGCGLCGLGRSWRFRSRLSLPMNKLISVWLLAESFSCLVFQGSSSEGEYHA